MDIGSLKFSLSHGRHGGESITVGDMRGGSNVQREAETERTRGKGEGPFGITEVPFLQELFRAVEMSEDKETQILEAF